jgi:hypothetical protein
MINSIWTGLLSAELFKGQFILKYAANSAKIISLLPDLQSIMSSVFRQITEDSEGRK